MTQIVRASVNPRLLTKADRLFTGAQAGRITEILQNARRAAATHVQITNHAGRVHVQDNGKGIHDFAQLLNLGSSHWEPDLEESEDPAGVGLFCLAPRQVMIHSHQQRLTITPGSWTGTPTPVHQENTRIDGTLLVFEDEPWTLQAVEPLAVFSGLHVEVDKTACAREPFIPTAAAPVLHDPVLGCRIHIHPTPSLTARHTCNRIWGHNVLVNFHGQVLSLEFHAVSLTAVAYLVELTGEPTPLRLMLPARTRLFENDASRQLLALLERCAFEHARAAGKHQLPYRQYQRARALGIDLPEAQPVYQLGLLSGDAPKPVAIPYPPDFPLSQCYRMGEGDEIDQANAHLLAALTSAGITNLGPADKNSARRGPASSKRAKEPPAMPFVPVRIPSEYNGYSWAKLPTIDRITVRVGKTIHTNWVWGGELRGVSGITITARTSDGRTFGPASVSMAVVRLRRDSYGYAESELCVTAAARRQLALDSIWFHLGGACDDGDTYDTQESAFAEELDEFWAHLLGPDEPLRLRLLEGTTNLHANWRWIKLAAQGLVTIRYQNGKTKTLASPPVPGPRPRKRSPGK